MGKILAICTSPKRGTVKTEVPSAVLTPEWGIVSDAHGGNWHRQVSLLSAEKIEAFRKKIWVDYGAFGENLVIEGFDFRSLPVTSRFAIGDVVLEMTQIGKECHNDCEIRRMTGMCVMPTDGIFAVVLNEGVIRPGDKIEVEREVQTVISAKKMEQKIMNVIPVFIILYLNLTSGEFLAPLYGNIFGISVMTGALGAYLAAIKISAKMTAIKV